MKFIALALAAIIGFASAQEFLPEPQYYGDILGNGEGLREGNGIKFNAEYGLIVATYRSGSIRAYNARTLDLEWERPASDFLDGSTFSLGGVSFGTASGQDFVTYGISTGIPYQAGTECYVIGLDMQGNTIFESGALTGQCSGSPVASGIMNAGAYVFVTSSVHVEPRSGHFSVVNTGDGSTFYTYESPIAQPMSPVGCNGVVSQGNYLGGELNSQDMCVFAHAPYNGEEVPGVAVNVANTAQFGYQPPAPNTDATSVVTLLGIDSEGLIDYFTKSAPVITDTYTMVMQISRSQTAMWAGISSLIDNDKYKANRFDKEAPNRPSAERGIPPSLGSFSSAAVDSNGAVYVSAAALEIKAWLEPELNSNGLPSWNISYVAGEVPYTGVVLSPDESRLYYQLGRSGTFSCLFAATGELCHENFAIPGGIAVWGDFEVSAEGIFYVGDISGIIHSFQLMELPTLDPTASPTPPPPTETPAPMEGDANSEPSGMPFPNPSSAPGDSTPPPSTPGDSTPPPSTPGDSTPPPTDAPNPTPTPAPSGAVKIGIFSALVLMVTVLFL